MVSEASIVSYLLNGSVLAVLVWVAKTTQANAVQLASIAQYIESAKVSSNKHDSDMTELRARITTCEVGLAQLKATCGATHSPYPHERQG